MKQRELEERAVHAGDGLAASVEQLYLASFPEHEIIPFSMLLAESDREGAGLDAYLDEGDVRAMTFSVELEHYLFVLYLAVAPAVRSQGYGSRVLARLKERAAGRCLVLDAEEPGTGAANETQRLRRLSFYRRNGFSDTGVVYFDGYETYRTLACGTTWDHAAFAAEARRFGGAVMEQYFGTAAPLA